MLNIKGRKASSNRSSLHVPFPFSLRSCICDERIFHKIYLTRTEIISALLFFVKACVFTSLNAVCGSPRKKNRLNVPISKFDSFQKKRTARKRIFRKKRKKRKKFKDKKYHFWEIARWQIFLYFFPSFFVLTFFFPPERR